MPNRFFFTDDREVAKQFLERSGAVQVSRLKTATSVRTVYEIETKEGTKTWIEWESLLEPPESFYQLKNLD